LAGPRLLVSSLHSRDNVRYGSKADLATSLRDVRFVPEADMTMP